MYKQHQNILNLKKLFKIYGLQIQNNNRNSISYGLYTFYFDDSTNYLTIYNCDRSNPFALLNNNIKTLQLHWESLESITQKLIKYGILPISSISTTRRTIPKAVNKVAQSQLQDTNKNYARLLG